MEKYQKDILKEIPFWTILNLVPTIVAFLFGGFYDALIVFSAFEITILLICFTDFFDKDSIGNMNWKKRGGR